MNRAPLASKLCTTCGGRYAADALFCPSDGTPLSSSAAAAAAHAEGSAEKGGTPDPYLGREISGHIEIRQLAGVGAMGRVYRAFQRGIDRDVAVKILHRELSANQQLVARFHREAKVASRLQHPNVVQVHLAGQLPDGALYIVMEYLDGLSLQSALAAAGGAIPLPRALRIALTLCDAVGEAHAQGVVHRDLKPENVMLVRRGDDADYVKVLDFGIARLNWGEQSMATAAGLIFGTARYISPEGAQGEQVGPQGDVYSIAILLYQMVAGRTPFEGDQAVALLVQQIHDPPPELRSISRAAYVPDPIARVVMKNLAKEQAGRAPDARELGRALLEAAKASGLSADDLIVRSGLFGARPNAMKLPPTQRTERLELSTEVIDRMSGAHGAHGTAYETPSGSEPVLPHFPAPHGATPPVANATTKWTPPPGFAAQLVPPTSAPTSSEARNGPVRSAREPSTSGVSPISPARPSPSEPRLAQRSVDETLDDESAPIVPAPHIHASAPTSSEARSAPMLVLPAPRTAFESEPSYRIPPVATAPPARAPLGSADVPLEEDVPAGIRRRPSALVFVAGFFLLGAALALPIAYKRGLIGGGAPAPASSSLEDQVVRAGDALKHKRWDLPAGDNVRDLTAEGLARWPDEPRLLDMRARATDELVKEALGKKFAGDLPNALHLARLARELDPTDSTAQRLVDELEHSAGPLTPIVSTAAASAKPAASTPGHGARPSTGPAAGAARVQVEASNVTPRVGQQVELVAKVLGPGGAAPRGPAEEPYFQIVAAGGAAIRLPALVESATTYKATFTFLEAGRYEVVFNAKSEGAALRGARTLVVAGSAPPAAPPGDAPPAPSGKWL